MGRILPALSGLRADLRPIGAVGVLVYSQAGAMPPAVLENLITSVKSLDMNAMRAKIAARKASEAR